MSKVRKAKPGLESDKGKGSGNGQSSTWDDLTQQAINPPLELIDTEELRIDAPSTAENGLPEETGFEPVNPVTEYGPLPGEQVRIVSPGAILRWDIRGFTETARAFRDAYAKTDELDEAADRIRSIVDGITQKMRAIGRAYGAKLGEQFGDGSFMLFEGEFAEEDGPTRAAKAARAMHEVVNHYQRKIKITAEDVRDPLKVRIALDLVESTSEDQDPDLVALSVGGRGSEVNGLVGRSAEAVEALHKDKGRRDWVRTTERFEKMTQIKNEVSFGVLEQDTRSLQLEQNEAQDASYRFSAFAFIHLKGISQLAMRRVRGSEEDRLAAKAALDNIGRHLAEAKKRYGGRVGAIDGEVVLVDFRGTPAGMKGVIDFTQDFLKAADEVEEVEVSAVINVGQAVEDYNTLFSDSVNETARMLVRGNEIGFRGLAIMPAAEDYARQRLDLEVRDLEAQGGLKGIGEAVEWKALLEAKEKEESVARQDLVGRERQLEEYDRLWEEVRTKGVQREWVILGDTRVGKTALVRAAVGGQETISIKAEEDADILDPIRKFGRQAFGISAGDNEQVRSQKVAEAFTDSELAEDLAILNHILGTSFVSSGRLESMNEGQREELLAELLAAGVNVTEGSKAVVVEDLQFFSPSALRLLNKIRDKFQGGVLTVYTSRNLKESEAKEDREAFERLGSTWEMTVEGSSRRLRSQIGALEFYELTDEDRQGEFTYNKKAQAEFMKGAGARWSRILRQTIPDFADTMIDHEDKEIPIEQSSAWRRLVCHLSEKAQGVIGDFKDLAGYVATFRSERKILVTNKEGKLTFGKEKISNDLYVKMPQMMEVRRERFFDQSKAVQEILYAGALEIEGFTAETVSIANDNFISLSEMDRLLEDAVRQKLVTRVEMLGENGEVVGYQYKYEDEALREAIRKTRTKDKFKEAKHERLLEHYKGLLESGQQVDLALLEWHARNAGLKHLGESIHWALELARGYKNIFPTVVVEKLEPALDRLLLAKSEDVDWLNLDHDEFFEAVREYQFGIVRNRKASPQKFDRLTSVERFADIFVRFEEAKSPHETIAASVKFCSLLAYEYGRAGNERAEEVKLMQYFVDSYLDKLDDSDKAYALRKTLDGLRGVQDLRAGSEYADMLGSLMESSQSIAREDIRASYGLLINFYSDLKGEEGHRQTEKWANKLLDLINDPNNGFGDVDMATAYRAYVYAMSRSGIDRLDSVLEYAQKAYELARKVSREDRNDIDLQRGGSLLGEVYFLRREYGKAAKFFEGYYRYISQNSQPNHKLLDGLLRALAHSYAHIQSIEGALFVKAEMERRKGDTSLLEDDPELQVVEMVWDSRVLPKDARAMAGFTQDILNSPLLTEEDKVHSLFDLAITCLKVGRKADAWSVARQLNDLCNETGDMTIKETLAHELARVS